MKPLFLPGFAAVALSLLFIFPGCTTPSASMMAQTSAANQQSNAAFDSEAPGFPAKEFHSRSEAVAAAYESILQAREFRAENAADLREIEGTGYGIRLMIKGNPGPYEWANPRHCFLKGKGPARILGAYSYSGNGELFFHTCPFFTAASKESIVIVLSAARYLATHPPLENKQIEEELEKFGLAAMHFRVLGKKPRLSSEASKLKAAAEERFQARDHLGAAWLYGQALQLNPGWPNGHYNHALLLADSGFFDEAILAIRKFIALMPETLDEEAASALLFQWGQSVETQKKKFVQEGSLL